MVAVLISNTVFAITQIMFWSVCWQCTVEITFWILSRWIMGGINLIFLIHRAKLVQEVIPNPVLGAKWFDTILPRCIIMPFPIFAIFAMISVGDTYFMKETVCKTYSDTDIFEYCDLKTIDDQIRAGAVAMICVNFVFSAFLLTLFMVPLYRVYREDHGLLNLNQSRGRQKLKQLLIWCAILSFVNQITSALQLLPVFGNSSLIWVLWTIGKFDPVINVWTSWLMHNRLTCRQVSQKIQFRTCERYCKYEKVSVDSSLIF